jgi:hypothetical protein
LQGTDAGKYTLSLAGAPTTTANITAKELKIGGTFTAQNKPYDGTDNATINANNLTLTGVETGDDVTLTGLVIAFNNASVGTGKTVSITSANLEGDDAENYNLSLADAPTTTANITAKELKIGGSFTAQSKSYDGTVSATINANNLTLTGVETGDDVNLTGLVIAFNNASVGNGKTVSITSASLEGDDAENYNLSLADAPTGTGDITARNLVLNNFTAVNKVYDGTTDVKNSGFNDNRIAGDELIFTYNVRFSDKNVGIGKTVNFTDIEISGGEHKDNYNLITTVSSATATISAFPLNLNSFTASSKVYDGTVNVEGTGFNDNRIAGDLIAFSYTARFSDKNAGTGKTVQYTDIQISGGEDAVNYNLSVTSGTTTADITKKTLFIEGSFTALDKLYDESADATLDDNNLELSGIVALDNVFLYNLIIEFENAAQGAGKTVYIVSADLDGNDAGNYSLSLDDSPTSSAAIISPPVINNADYNAAAGNLIIYGQNLKPGSGD